jgi:citrate synthase
MIADAHLTQAIDGLALAMVLLLGFALGMILTILFVMARHSGHRSDHAPEEVEEKPAPRPKARRETGDTRRPWERDADWWRGDNQDD